MPPISLDQDFHVHSHYTPGVKSTVQENLREAEWAGLRTLCLVDHADATSSWLDERREAVRALRPMTNIEVLCGIEVDLVDVRGNLDLPATVGLDHVLIADHHFPSEDGPRTLDEVRASLDRGTISPSDVVSHLIEATVAAMSRVERPIIAHPFSFLGQLGFDDAAITSSQLQHFAQRARTTQALVEVNEKWTCPGPRVVSALAQHGVHLVAGSDSHRYESVGAYRYVRDTLGAVATGTPPGF